MAIELKQVLDYLDIEATEETTFDDVKAGIDGKFIKATPEAVKSNEKLYGELLGSINGAFVTRLRKASEKMGIELTKEEIENNQTVELIDLFGEKAKEKISEYPTKIETLTTELEEAKKKGASAKDLEKLQTEISNWETKYNDLDSLHKTTADEFDTYKSQVADEKKNFVISRHKQEEFEKANLKFQNEYEKKGFLQDVDSKYKLDLDGDEAIVRDKEGKRIPNPEKAGSFMSYAEVLKKEGKDFENDNPHDGKRVQKPNSPVIPDRKDNDKEIIRPVRRSTLMT